MEVGCVLSNVSSKFLVELARWQGKNEFKFVFVFVGENGIFPRKRCAIQNSNHTSRVQYVFEAENYQSGNLFTNFFLSIEVSYWKQKVSAPWQKVSPHIRRYPKTGQCNWTARSVAFFRQRMNHRWHVCVPQRSDPNRVTFQVSKRIWESRKPRVPQSRLYPCFVERILPSVPLSRKVFRPRLVKLSSKSRTKLKYNIINRDIPI